jgi:hypothetical protein
MYRIIFALVLCLTATATCVLAQPQRQPRVPRPGTPEYVEWELLRRATQQAKPEEWKATGKIHSFNVRAGEVNVLADDGQQWRVKLSPTAQVSVTGEGGAEFLQPRAAVRFYAPISKKKVVAEPVTKIEAFSPRDQFEPALEPTTEEEARAAMAAEETGEETGEEGADRTAGEEVAVPEDITTDDPPALEDRVNREPKRVVRGSSRRGSDSKADDEGPPEWFHVQGILLSLKKNKFVVDAGEGGKIRGELAEDVEVDADLVGIQFANVGDTIQATGTTFPTQAQTAVATKADITLNPRPEPSDDNPRRPARKGGRRGERNEDPNLGAESEETDIARPKRSIR